MVSRYFFTSISLTIWQRFRPIPLRFIPLLFMAFTCAQHEIHETWKQFTMWPPQQWAINHATATKWGMEFLWTPQPPHTRCSSFTFSASAFESEATQSTTHSRTTSEGRPADTKRSAKERWTKKKEGKIQKKRKPHHDLELHLPTNNPTKVRPFWHPTISHIKS